MIPMLAYLVFKTRGDVEVKVKQAMTCSFDFSNYLSWLLENTDVNDNPFQVV
jgi:hypothetical protein